MGTSGALYLVMTIATASGFALVLAYYSWRHGKWRRARAASAPEQTAPSHTQVHA